MGHCFVFWRARGDEQTETQQPYVSAAGAVGTVLAVVLKQLVVVYCDQTEHG